MIFATVGTHEDPFDRLVLELERLQPLLAEEIVIQAGYTRVAAPHCAVSAMLDFQSVQALMARARVVVTHGGPASIMQALAHGKIPVVVPRQSVHGEHVDDHQVRFTSRIASRIVQVLEIGQLEAAIRTAGTSPPASGSTRAQEFALRFDALCEEVIARPGSRGPPSFWRPWRVARSPS